MDKNTQHNHVMKCCIDRHSRRLFDGLPRAIATRSAVMAHEREQHRIEDVLDDIERAISKGRTTK